MGLQEQSPSMTLGRCRNGQQCDKRSVLLAGVYFLSGAP